ncbi:hypothetical protein OV320_2573 [Actinobacteria bacterium OV320]|jgi:uncharacterized membrane protein|nr:hypothetical protein OV320_2573 [Actinobacteria bacterium OV320]
MLASTLSVLALVISVGNLFFARRGYLRAKAHLAAVEARYPHLAARAAEK